MSRSRPGRNPKVERRERESFVVLQHIHTLAETMDHPLSARRVISELALPEDEGLAVLGHLDRARLVDWDRIDGVELREEGKEYVEWRAGRRRSVRLEDRGPGGEVRAPPTRRVPSSGDN